MPFDINEDKQLRIVWFKYENEIKGLKTHFHKNEKINSKSLKYNRISDNMFEKQLELDTQIRNLEEQRRKEMKEIRTKVRKEKAEKKANEKLELEKKNQEIAEKKRINRKLRELRKEQQKTSPPPLRRSARVYNKSNSVVFERRGSFYKKEQ